MSGSVSAERDFAGTAVEWILLDHLDDFARYLEAERNLSPYLASQLLPRDGPTHPKQNTELLTGHVSSKNILVHSEAQGFIETHPLARQGFQHG